MSMDTECTFGKKLKTRVLLNKKGFCLKSFVLKIVPSMEKRGKDKPSEDSECCMKVLSKS
jgi:hypothetical protein